MIVQVLRTMKLLFGSNGDYRFPFFSVPKRVCSTELIGKYHCQTYQCVRNIFGDGGEVGHNESHQVGAHVDTALLKLIQ